MQQAPIQPLEYFYHQIGLLDRILSELLIVSSRENLDEADAQTLKHHADDLIGAGKKLLKNLSERGVS